MGGFLHDLQQIAERLGVHEEDGRTAGTGSRGGVDDLHALGTEMVKRDLDIGHSIGDVSESAAPSVALDQFRNRRGVAEGLQELDEIGSAADAQQNFADLIGTQDVLAMHFFEPELLIGGDLLVQLAWPDRDREMIDTNESGKHATYLPAAVQTTTVRPSPWDDVKSAGRSRPGAAIESLRSFPSSW